MHEQVLILRRVAQNSFYGIKPIPAWYQLTQHTKRPSKKIAKATKSQRLPRK